MLEREPYTGGQSITFEKDGFSYDLGPHNIHSKRDSVLRFLQNMLGEDFVEHEIGAEIFFQNKRIKYPFEGRDIFKAVSLWTTFLFGMSYIYTKTRTTLMGRYPDDGSYRTWIINRFGKKFYDMFFGPYSEKVWGVPPAELSKVIAEKRIAVKGILELVYTVLFKVEQYHPENPRMQKCYYPRHGVGMIQDNLRRGVEKFDGHIVLDAEVKRLKFEDWKISEVNYMKNGVGESIIIEENDYVLSTLPLNEMISMIEGPVPEEVKIAAQKLDFTAEVFLYLNVKQQNVFGIPLFYFSEKLFPFNRVYDVGAFSRAMCPQDMNALCFEFTCSSGDKVWNENDESLFHRSVEELEKYGFLKRQDITGYHTRRLAHAYPRFRVGYDQNVKAIFEFVDNTGNLVSFGREGLFAYANIDDCIWMSMEVSKHLPYMNRMPLRMSELLPEYITY